MHVPVLLEKVLEILDLSPGQFVIDGTLGGGGHAREIIKRISPNGKFLGIDRDKRAIDNFEIESKSITEAKIALVNDNYANTKKILEIHKLGKADRLILDLGFSSDQLDSPTHEGRGFSFLKSDEPLLMTYDDSTKPLREVLGELTEEEIEKVIRELSDERYSAKIAKAIFEREKKSPMERVGELVQVIKDSVPSNYEAGRINPATRTFMGLRIFVNDELGAIRKILEDLNVILKPGGIAAIISFHSIEDRLIKNLFKEMEKEGQVKILTKKVIKPDWEEVKSNPRSRSSKLRAIKLVS